MRDQVGERAGHANGSVENRLVLGLRVRCDVEHEAVPVRAVGGPSCLAGSPVAVEREQVAARSDRLALQR